MSTKRTRRHRPVTQISSISETFEGRALLTQLVPVADLAGRYPQVIADTSDVAILSAFTNQQNLMEVAVIDKANGSLGQWQLLPGNSAFVASADGNTLLSSVNLYAPDGVFNGREHYFYHRSASTGLFEQTARYEFLSAEFGYSVTAEAISAEGAYVNTYGSTNSANLYFMPSSQVPEPNLVFGGNTGQATVATRGRSVFAFGNSVGLQLLQPDGLNPKQVGSGDDIPVGVINGKALVSRYGGTLRRLVSVDLATGAEQNLLVYPTEGFIQLFSENGGPGGKAILGLSEQQRFDIISTDGTISGTKVIPTAQRTIGASYENTAVVIPGTNKVLVSRAAAELWAWDLNDGSGHRLIDTNPFGSDVISSLTSRDSDAWFMAQTEDSRFGLYRTDGLQTTLEFYLPRDSSPQIILGMDDAYLLDRYAQTGAVPGRTRALYKIDQDAADLNAGPANLATTIVTAGDSRVLDINWDSVNGVDFYEVIVVPWLESGRYASSPGFLDQSGTAYETNFTVDITGKSYYGWQTVLVRGITNAGVATQWSSLTFSLTEEISLPANGKFFFDQNALRFGFQSYHRQNYRIQVRRSDSPETEYLFNDFAHVASASQIGDSPFPNASFYFYYTIPNPEDGDYVVSFFHQYDDPNPVTKDLSLPRKSLSLPLSIRNKMVVRNPEALNVTVQPDSVQLSWNGTLQVGDEGFEVWVSDVGRGVPRVIHQTVAGHSLQYDLPNGRYQGWVGLKDPATGITHWSPGKEFTVANKAPRIVAPGPISAVEKPVFQWTGRKSSTYEIWFSDLRTNQRIVLATVSGATQWTPTSPLPAGRYAFWVRELISSTEASPWSTRRLLTQQEPAIQVISGLAPGLDQTPVIGWQAREGAASYELWISREGVAGPAFRQSGITGTTHQIQVALGNGNFKVWVRADLGGGRLTGWGDGYTMSIGANVSVNVTGTTITWNAVPSATHYEFWINYEGGERAKQAKLVYLPFYTPTTYKIAAPLPKGRYTAWIRAVRAESGKLYEGAWSKPVEVQLSQGTKADLLNATLLTEVFKTIANDGLPDTSKATNEPDYSKADDSEFVAVQDEKSEKSHLSPGQIRAFACSVAAIFS